jgi:hypothetical protein
VIESLVLAKKYVTPVLLFHPFVIGGVEAAYWAGWRFNPAKGALIFDQDSPELTQGLERPLTEAERRFYQGLVVRAKRASYESEEVPSWRRFEAGAEPRLDAAGQPFLRLQIEGRPVQLGLCRSNTLQLSAPPEIVEGLVLTRMQEELKRKPARVSDREMRRDWDLLGQARAISRASIGP